MQWKTRFKLRKLTQHSHILLPGIFTTMDHEYKYSKNLLDKKVVFTTDEIKALRPVAIFTWDNCKQYDHISDHKPTRCLNSLKPKDSHTCFKILSPSKLKYYVIFNFIEQSETCKHRTYQKDFLQICYDLLTTYSKLKNEGKKFLRQEYCNFSIPTPLKMTSWKKHICKNMDGSLPHFRFKKELDELIALFKLSESMPPLNAMFIGLKFHLNQVHFCSILLVFRK